MAEDTKRSNPGAGMDDEAAANDKKPDLDLDRRAVSLSSSLSCPPPPLPPPPSPISALDIVCRRAAAEAVVSSSFSSSAAAATTTTSKKKHDEKKLKKLLKINKGGGGGDNLERALALGRLALVLSVSSSSPPPSSPSSPSWSALREEFSPLFSAAAAAAAMKKVLGDALIDACRESCRSSSTNDDDAVAVVVDSCRALVAAGADPEHSTEHGDTPLTVAASSGCPELVSFFLFECGCDPDGSEKACTPPVHAAIEGAAVDCYGKAWGRHGECALLLLEAGADPEARDVPPGRVAEVARLEGGNLNEHWSALHRAALRGLPGVCAMLLGPGGKGGGEEGEEERGGEEEGSEAETKGPSVRRRRRRFVEDPSVRGPCGQTPLDLALYRRHAAVVEVLRAAGAREGAEIGKKKATKSKRRGSVAEAVAAAAARANRSNNGNSNRGSSFPFLGCVTS